MHVYENSTSNSCDSKMMGIDLLVYCVVFISAIYLYGWIKRFLYYPPGPYNLPFIGFLPFVLAEHPHEFLAKLRHKYGNLFGFRLGNRYIVVLDDYNTIKDLINKEELLDRPNIPPMNMFEKNSISQANGEIYKREKRLSMKILHKLAFEQNFLENVIREEINCLMDILKTLEGKPRDIKYLLKRSTTNNISSLLFGRRFDYEDYRSHTMLEAMELFDQCKFYADPTVFFPFLKLLMRVFGGAKYRKRIQWSSIMETVIRKELEEHKKDLNEDHIRDYIDAYLSEIEKKNNFHSETSLLGNAKAFAMGGIVTTATIVEWFLIAMALHQDIQTRCFEEIKDVIGLEKSIEYSDLKVLPYFRTVMLETFRWKTTVPLGGIRSISKDVEYKGYILPKNSFVFSNLWAVHNDPDLWKKPNEFTPENFLDEDGNIINAEFCIPFNIGRRSCPGENIGHIQIFHYMVTMLQKFSFHPPDGEIFDLDGIFALTYYPKPFKIVFYSRK